MRLIDADKLIRRMRIDMDRMKYQYNLDVIEGMRLAIGYIVGTPTAYDVDEVVEQLESNIEDSMNGANDIECAYWNRGIERAIEIVKGGEVDE